ncbi:MAG: MBL fold metallo-hydrolase [Thiothrix sp.]|nr:MBL fold metallo-hydrolase [Thiothrix sp.]HPE60681.1 MBL fold metallo-hydrolase [Thiolinea sp.]
MTRANYQALGDGIFCIDTELYRHSMAACYLVAEGDALAFVDTGPARAGPLLLDVLEQLGYSPAQVRYIIPTHVHLDHGGGAGALLQHCPDATLITHPKGLPHLIEPARLQAGAEAVYGVESYDRHFGALVPVPAARALAAADELVIDLAGRRLQYVHTPGHANHHGCVFDERTRSCFTGDAFGIAYPEFQGEYGPWVFATTTPVAFDPAAWATSLDRLMALEPAAMLLTHYGRVDDLEHLEPQLRTSLEAMTAIALSEEGSPQAGRFERIRTKVAANLFAGAQQHAPRLSAARINTLLDGDYDLNAQGLEVWLQRRARAARQGGGNGH